MIFKTSKKLFAHIDADSFFASCEILRNPSLKNKYVCVGSEIVIAANYKAKGRWIKVGMPVWQVREILWENVIILWVDFELYGSISRKLMKYLQENTLCMEKFSIDEAFCEITGLAQMNKMSVLEYSRFLQNDIFQKIGITVSIGISNTRIKAKIFSDIHKPNGICIGNVTNSEKDLFKKVPFWDIPFAGRKTQLRFQYRAKTIDDFMKLWFWILKSEVGKSMTTLWLELNWVNAFIVKMTPQPKSIFRSRSFNKNKTNNKEFLITKLLGHFETVYTRITQKSVEIREVSIMLRHCDKNTSRLSYKFPEHTNDRKKILFHVQQLFQQAYSSDQIYRSTGVVFHGLRSYLPRQMNLFEKEFQKKDNSYELSRTINKINSKYWWLKVNFWKDLIWAKKSEKLFIRW